MKQNIINHIAFLVDKSGSIKFSGLEKSIVSAFDAQIKNLKLRSDELEQETRVSIYLFNEDIECLFYDVDVNKIPSLAKYYHANGDTALIDGTLKVISDLQKTNELYGDHAYLIYVLTDGKNRINNHLADKLNKTINNLPENYTIAAVVPNQDSVFECKKFGFPRDNVQVWEQTAKGVSEVSYKMTNSTDHYMMARSTGLRGTKSLFNLNTDKLNTRLVKSKLEELSPNEYDLLPVRKDSAIRDYVEGWLGEYRIGSGYYQLMKPETIQANKNLCIQDRTNGRIYTGQNARKMLGLPNYDIKVNPETYGKFDIFCQSTSTNRKLIKGTKLIILK